MSLTSRFITLYVRINLNQVDLACFWSQNLTKICIHKQKCFYMPMCNFFDIYTIYFIQSFTLQKPFIHYNIHTEVMYRMHVIRSSFNAYINKHNRSSVLFLYLFISFDNKSLPLQLCAKAILKSTNTPIKRNNCAIMKKN